SSDHTEQEKQFHSVPKDVRSYKNVWSDIATVSSHRNASGPTHQVAGTNELGQRREPGSGYSLLSTDSMTMMDGPVCTDTHNIDTGKTLFTFQKPSESLSTFQNLIESSWMSASLHRSILALGSEEGVTFAKPQACDFSMSALLLYSPRISLPFGRSQHNSFPLGGLMHAQHERELQLTNSHKMFQPGSVPGVLAQENNMGHAKMSHASQLPVPTCSALPSSDMELHARRPAGAHKLALDRQVNKANMAQCVSHLERLEMKENVSQMDPEGNRSFRKKSCSQKEPRQVETSRRSNENQTGQASRWTEHWYLDWHRAQFDKERSTNRTFQASSRHGGSSGTPRPKGGLTKQGPLSSWNQVGRYVGLLVAYQLHAAPQIFFSAADEEIAERFQALYRFRLLLRCFRRWRAGLSSLSKARLYQQRKTLGKAVCALQHAVLLQRAQVDLAVRRENALVLAQAFQKWKDLYGRRQLLRLNPDSCSEDHIAALRRRLVKAMDSQALRITYCAWRSHIQGQRIHRAAVIHHHLVVLCKYWLLWRQAWLEQSSRSQQQWQQASVWCEERLRRRAWTAWLYVWRERQQTAHLHSQVLQRWHQNTQRARLMRLTQTVEQLLSTRTLSGKCFSAWRRRFLHRTLLVSFSRRQKVFTASIFFKRWRRALELRWLQKHLLFFLFFRRQRTFQDTSAAVQATTTTVMVDLYGQDSLRSVDELWARLVLQAAFYTWRERLKKQQLARWHHTARVREKMRAELLKWHRLTQAELCDRVLSFRARLALFHTPHSTGLLDSSGLDHSLDYTDPTGQQVALKHCINSAEPGTCLEPNAYSMLSIPVREQHCPLQASSPFNKQITKSVCYPHYSDRRQEAEASEDVGIVSDPHQSCSHRCRGETVALRALIRIMQPELSLAFCQWRALLHSSRQMKQQADLFTTSRRLTCLEVAFGTWRTHRERQHKAAQHREMVLLSSSVTSWKRLMWWRHREHCLQQEAIHFHQTTLIKHCYSAWHRQAVPEPNRRLERVEWRVKRRLLGWAFSTWAECERQQKSASVFCTRTLLMKVFPAWQKCVQCHKDRHAVAWSFVQHRLCSAAFSQWRSSWTRQQLANNSASRALRQSAKHMLLCWREYTQNRCLMHVHLRVFIEERERALKWRAILVWQQAAENFKRSQQFYHRVLLYRLLLAWHIHTVSAQRMRYSEACFQYDIELRMMGSCFGLWRRVLIQAQSRQCVLEDLLKLFHSRLTAQTFKHWRAATTLHSAAKKINTAILQKWYVCWTQQRDALRTAKLFHAQRQKEAAHLVLTSWSSWAKVFASAPLCCMSPVLPHTKHVLLDSDSSIKGAGRWRKLCVSGWKAGAWVRYSMSGLKYTGSIRWPASTAKCTFYTGPSQDHHRPGVVWVMDRSQHCSDTDVVVVGHSAHGGLLLQRHSRSVRLLSCSSGDSRSKELLEVGDGLQHPKRLVMETNRTKLLRAVFQAWHHKAKALRQRELHLSEKFFSLWLQEVQRRQSERLLQARWRAKWLRRWRYRVVERREQRELTRLYWASWKSQTAASLLYSQKHERDALQRAWLTWRKRRIRNRMAAAYTASLNRSLLLKAFRLWWQRALVLGFLPSRAPSRSYSL
ncbi:hypothetical protein NFI96_034581, partial [Prochilodus magdalenae]